MTAALLPAAPRPLLPDWLSSMRAIVPHGYVCRHTATPIKVDGVLDEPAWSDASWTLNFVDIEGDAKPLPRFRTRARMLWDDDYLYIAAELEEPHVWATLTKHDSVIFADPDFEVFMDPDGDTHEYYEFEINALNTFWDLKLGKPYIDGGPARKDWEIPGIKTAVHVDGTINNPNDTDRGWTVEIAFPWKVLSEHARHPGPPVEGEQWRINFSRVEWRVSVEGGKYHKIPRKVSPEDNWVWSPQGVIDMHRPEMWGILQFTREPVATPVVAAPIRGKAARDLVLTCYYAQKDYWRAHGRWAAGFDELGWSPEPLPAGVESPVFKSLPDGYRFSASFHEHGHLHTWTITQNRLLKLE